MVDYTPEFNQALSSFLCDSDTDTSIDAVPLEENERFSSKRTFEYSCSIKLKFCCDCGHNWTTSKGLMDIDYYLDKRTNDLEFKATLYRQDCQDCSETCMPDDFEDELNRVAESFANKMFAILFGIKKDNNY